RLCAGYAEGSQLAGLDLWRAGSRAGKVHLDFTSQERCHHQRTACIGYAHYVEATHGLEQLGSEMRWSTQSAGGIIERARFGFRECDQVSHGSRGYRRMDDKYQRGFVDHGYRREVLVKVIRCFLQERRNPQETAGDQQRIAIRRCLGDDLRYEIRRAI